MYCTIQSFCPKRWYQDFSCPSSYLESRSVHSRFEALSIKAVVFYISWNGASGHVEPKALSVFLLGSRQNHAGTNRSLPIPSLDPYPSIQAIPVKMIVALGFQALNCQELEQVKYPTHSALDENHGRNQSMGRSEDIVFRSILTVPVASKLFSFSLSLLPHHLRMHRIPPHVLSSSRPHQNKSVTAP